MTIHTDTLMSQVANQPCEKKVAKVVVQGDDFDEDFDDEMEDVIRVSRSKSRRLAQFVRRWNLKEGEHYWVVIRGYDGDRSSLDIGAWSGPGSMTQSGGSFAMGGRDVGFERILKVVRRIPRPRGY